MPNAAKGDGYTVFYAAIVCILCSLLLAVAAGGLRPRQEQMVELDRKFNVLKAFGAPVADAAGRRISGAEVEKLYNERVRERVIDAEKAAVVEGRSPAEISPADLAARRLLPLYEWIEDGRPTRFAFPVSGKGLWSTIYGYVALDGDLRSIVGVTFYKHGETPGLGGEIERDWFQNQFRGRELLGPEGFKPILVAKGAAGMAAQDPARVVVDGISGATLTGKGVTQFLNADIARYEAYFRTRRAGGG